MLPPPPAPSLPSVTRWRADAFAATTGRPCPPLPPPPSPAPQVLTRQRPAGGGAAGWGGVVVVSLPLAPHPSAPIGGRGGAPPS